jgi:hypothetical protein
MGYITYVGFVTNSHATMMIHFVCWIKKKNRSSQPLLQLNTSPSGQKPSPSPPSQRKTSNGSYGNLSCVASGYLMPMCLTIAVRQSSIPWLELPIANQELLFLPSKPISQWPNWSPNKTIFKMIKSRFDQAKVLRLELQQWRSLFPWPMEMKQWC